MYFNMEVNKDIYILKKKFDLQIQNGYHQQTNKSVFYAHEL